MSEPRTFSIYWCPRCEIQVRGSYHVCERPSRLIPQNDVETESERVEVIEKSAYDRVVAERDDAIRKPKEPGTMQMQKARAERAEAELAEARKELAEPKIQNWRQIARLEAERDVLREVLGSIMGELRGWRDEHSGSTRSFIENRIRGIEWKHAAALGGEQNDTKDARSHIKKSEVYAPNDTEGP